MASVGRFLPSTAAGLLLLLGASLPALADDPPGRVGRLSEAHGTVSFHALDDEQWSPAALNEPVTSGDAFWTEPAARTEIRIGSTTLHMDQSTELDVTTLDDQQFVASLPQGMVNLRIVRLEQGDSYTIATPRGLVSIHDPGTYRIEAGTDQDPTKVAVLEGEARIVAPNSTLTLTRGELGIVTGSDQLSFEIEEARATPFDDDVLAQERREEAPRPALRYVSPEMTGYEDLDDHGDWRTEPNYGAVWYPRAVPVDWAPYHYGHWRWVAPWGWTWIDDEPWGFAPFHYGRWAYVGGRWGWVPGSVVVRPVYAPALVAFVGGAGWNLSVSIGQEPAVGWFPLAPREVFVPSYPTSVNYVRNVNVTNVTNVTNITQQTINHVQINNVNVTHVNQRFTTVVPQTAFASARPVQKAALAVPSAALASAPMTRAAPITPQAAALSGRPQAVAAAQSFQQHGGPGGAPLRQASNEPVTLAKPTGPAAPGPTIKPADQRAKVAAVSPFSRPAGQTPSAGGQAQVAPTPPQGQPQQRQPSQTPAAQQGPRNQANLTPNAAPGPPIPHRNQTTTGTAPLNAGPTAPVNPNPANPAPANPPANASIAAGGGGAKPATGTGQATTQLPAQASPPPSASPGPPIRPRTDTASLGHQPTVTAPAAPSAPVPPKSPTPQTATPQGTQGTPPQGARLATPEQPPAKPAPPQPQPQPQAKAPTQFAHNNAPPPRQPTPPTPRVTAPSLPPEHNAPHPVQQTVLQPTKQGWVRNPAPPPQPAHAAPPPPQPQQKKQDPNKKPQGQG
jgi:hypothetical protein